MAPPRPAPNLLAARAVTKILDTAPATTSTDWRRLPIGAEPAPDGGVHFRVWAPKRRRVELVIEGAGTLALDAEAAGYWSALVDSAAAGTRYRYLLDGTDRCPDPASRFQPEGPHGPSEVIDPAAFRWSDEHWPGPPRRGQVLYELHVGTFTKEGTWAAATRELPWLAELGITCIEVMPVASFTGEFGWGYDGVALFAPTHLYGTPDDCRRFVDSAHALGMAVLLDVVYNHLGPDGNYLKSFADAYFSHEHSTEWGEGLNFDGADNGPVREFFLANASYWVNEFHIDGLRLDATQSIVDASARHIITEVRSAVRRAAHGRGTIVVAENEPQESWLLHAPEAGGAGLDMLWNDDFHHSAVVALTGKREAYYTDYLGTPQEFVSAARHGFLYQGQFYRWQQKRRGSSTTGLTAPRFVHFLENHDQVANTADGRRMHQRTSPGRWRAMTALLLLGPQTPMLFQGEEFSASSPFLYFADHTPDLARAVREGRAAFLAQFPTVHTRVVRDTLPDPGDPATFRRSKLDLTERGRNVEAVALHRDLLRVRRDDPVIAAQGAHGLDGAVLAPDAFLLRFLGVEGDDRLLLVNLGRTLRLDVVPEPLLAPPPDRIWVLQWSSDDVRYGGTGTAHPEADHRMQGEDAQKLGPLKDAPVWHLPGECALLLAPAPLEDE